MLLYNTLEMTKAHKFILPVYRHLKDIIIVEDSMVDYHYLCRLIRKINPSFELFHATDFSILLELLEQRRPTLIIYNTRVGRRSAFSFYDRHEQLHDIPFLIVSQHTELALQAFQRRAVHFIKKPARMEELADAFRRVEEGYKMRSAFEHNEQSLYLPVLRDKALYYVPYTDVVYLRASGSYTFIVLQSREQICVSKNLGHYEALLPGFFVRINKSVIINIRFIKRIYKDNTGIELGDLAAFDISIRRRPNVLKQIQMFLSGGI